jgi:hypothetical protein
MFTTQRREETAMQVTRPIWILAALAALMIALTGCDRNITVVEETSQPQALSCFGCHSDSASDSLKLVDAEQQWNYSRHASGSTLNENDSSCKGCHTSEGFIARANGVAAPDVIENPTAIHCFTCHAPHTNGDFRLRWTANATIMDGTTYDLGAGNICVACHQSRRDVGVYVSALTSLSSRWGPHHGPQGDMLLGSNGYEYAGYEYDRSSHREATEDGCLDCHFKATNQYVVGGHSFNMEGMTSRGDEVFNTGACEPCHGAVSDFNLDGVQDSVDVLVEDLKARLVTAGLVDGTTGLPKSVKTSADSAGAVWNYLLAEEDRSHGVHNPKYITGLLKSAIQYIQTPGPVPVRLISSRD